MWASESLENGKAVFLAVKVNDCQLELESHSEMAAPPYIQVMWPDEQNLMYEYFKKENRRHIENFRQLRLY